MIEFAKVPLEIQHVKYSFDSSEDQDGDEDPAETSSETAYTFTVRKVADYVAHMDERADELRVVPCDVGPLDYDKRARAMVDLLNNPKANKKYNQNQAINLANKCLKAGRRDLYDTILSEMASRKMKGGSSG